MATLEQLSSALRNAHAAGDVNAARALAGAIKAAQGAAPPSVYDNPNVKKLTGSVQRPETYDESSFAQNTSGVNEGIANMLGTPVDLANAFLVNPAMQGANALFGTDFQPSQQPFLGSDSIKQMMGQSIKAPTTDPGKQFSRRVFQEFGQAAIPVGALASRAAQPLRMLASEGALTLGSGLGAATAQQVAPGSMIAELAGQGIGAGSVAGLSRLGRRAVTPMTVAPERRAMVNTLQQEGVELSAGQTTGNKGLQYAESELGGTRAAALTDRQGEQFTRAALRRAGINANRATPDVVDDAFTDIGQQFDDLAARNTLQIDGQLRNELQQAVGNYEILVPPAMQSPLIRRIVDEFIAPQNVAVSGQGYQAARSRLERMARTSTDPQLSMALRDIRTALDDAMERTLAMTNPQAAGRWREARRRYRNLLVIEDAIGRAGESAALGIITPANLRSATQRQGKRAYVRGRGEFAELARAGTAMMSPLPQSGTAPRTAVRNLGSALPAVAGAMFGSPAGIPGMIAGAAVGRAVPYAAGRFLMSPLGRRYLTNNLLPALPTGQVRGIGPAAGILSTLGQ